MPLSRTRKIRARRPRRTIAEQQMEGVSTISGASLVYAGYPFDPYA